MIYGALLLHRLTQFVLNWFTFVFKPHWMQRIQTGTSLANRHWSVPDKINEYRSTHTFCFQLRWDPLMNGFSRRPVARLCTLCWCQLIYVKADVMTALWHQMPYAPPSWHVHLSSEARTLELRLCCCHFAGREVSVAHVRPPSDTFYSSRLLKSFTNK